MKEEPNLRRINTFCDGRGFSFFDVFGDVPYGQINIGNLHSGIIKAFHRHQHQTDFWQCISGDIHVICMSPDCSVIKHFYIGEHNTAILEIPPGFWHGYCNVGDKVSTLLYLVTKRYDPVNADEERLAWDYKGKEIWEVENI